MVYGFGKASYSIRQSGLISADLGMDIADAV
jgi:hypothetical protein